MFNILTNHSQQHQQTMNKVIPDVNFYEVRGKHFVFDSNSMCVVQTDKELIEKLKDESKAKEQAFDGLLFSQLGPQFYLYPETRVQQLVLETTHACNLACTYCFVDSCYEDGHSPDVLTFEMAKEAIDRLLFKDLRVGFFGGEPLMNWPLVEDVVKYVNEKAARENRNKSFSMTTNGTLLTEDKIDFLEKHGFSIIVSLDGDEHIHNSCRKMRNGTGNSFQKTMEALERIRNRPLSKRITLRSTYTGRGANLVERLEFLNNLIDSGIGKWCSVEPVCLSENACAKVEDRHPDAITLDMLNTESWWRKEYQEAAEWSIERFNSGKPVYFHHFFKIIERLLWNMPNPSECGAGKGYMAVNGKGDLFACHREYLSEIGNIEYGIDESKRSKWLDNRVYNQPDCMKCPIRYVCGGGCRLEKIAGTGCINKANQIECWFKKVFFEEALYIMSECGRNTLAKFIMNPRQRKR